MFGPSDPFRGGYRGYVALRKLDADISKACTGFIGPDGPSGLSLSDLFPGLVELLVDDETPAILSQWVRTKVRCSACRMQNAMYNLDAPCDAVDDGSDILDLNGSCDYYDVTKDVQAPCIEKSAAGELTCAMRTFEQCAAVGGNSPSCFGFSSCIAAADSNHDGRVGAGDSGLCAEHPFVDNGNGTITDQLTGLMWEEKVAAGGLHNYQTLYSWAGLCDDSKYCQPNQAASRACLLGSINFQAPPAALGLSRVRGMRDRDVPRRYL